MQIFEAINNKRKSILKLAILWLLSGIIMIGLFLWYLSPIYEQELINTADYQETPLLSPGDTLTQSFYSSQSHLAGVEIAFSYADNIPSSTQATVRVYQNGQLEMEQPLQLKSLPQLTFQYFGTDIKKCKGEKITIEIQNTSQEENAEFSLMATDKDYIYLDNTEDYEINEKKAHERLLCRFTYFEGYSFYKSLTAAFLVLLVTLVANRYFSLTRNIS